MSVSLSCRRPPRAALLASLVLLAGAARVGAVDTSIAAGIAGLYVGEEKIVEGVVTGSERTGNTVRLTLGTPPRGLIVSLIIPLLNEFPPEPEHYYLGKTVRVVGTIQSFRGATEITVHDPTHIRIVTAATAAAPAGDLGAGGGPPPDATLRTALEALAQRVHLLEQRVEQLEGTRPAAQP